MSNSLEEYQPFLNEAIIPLRLSCRTQSGWPMILSLWYLYQDNAIYCATPHSAKVVGYLRHDPRCALEIAGDLPPYCGLRGQAKAFIEPENGLQVLEKLLYRYLGGTESGLAEFLLSKAENEVAIRLEPVNIFQWDFTSRMKDLPGAVQDKSCP